MGRAGLYRRPSTGTVLLFALGVVGLGLRASGTAVTAVSPQVVVALSGTLVVGAVLNHALVPGDDLPATVTDSVADAASDTVERVVERRGLPDRRVYVPATDGDGPRLVVTADDGPPEATADEALGGTEQTAVFTPTAAGAVDRFDHRRAETVDRYVDALCDGLVSVYELALTADGTVEGRTATVVVDGVAVGDPTRIDHPVTSFLGTGLAVALDRPVTLAVDRSDTDAVTVRLDWAEKSTPPAG